ncbi:MAG TPA: POTRA domain-containing protein [Xanthobacteraceae bacterium]|jgi:hemolysin activation/secretion protein|nr:POTRA domain-containing protein [Xanthobacteraceae bacterium]
MRSAVCRAIAALALVVVATAAEAQPVVPSSVQPGREQQRFTEPPPPQSQPGGPAISLPSTVAPKGADQMFVLVRDVRIEGATVYKQDELAPLSADLIGHRVTLQAIYDLAQKITTKYGNDGYVISRAIVPPQQLDPHGAIVHIKVIEGYVDKVEWPHAIEKYRDFFSYYTMRITAERPANIHNIERYLLLAGDLPGLKFKNSLKPSSANQGAATLIVELTGASLVDWAARVDNRGPPGQGPLEFLASATANNLLRIHDAFTLTYAGPFKTEELKYIYGQYSQVLIPEGLSFFVDASDGWGRPGTSLLQTLDYRTKSTVLETGLAFPVLRTRERNLSVTGLWFASHNEGSILDMPDTPPSTRDDLRGARFKANGDWADPFNGINQVNVIVSKGVQGLGATSNGQPLASRINGRVDFSKVEATVTRVQQLPANFSFLIAAYGQYAGTALLNPEMCGYGGRVFGRAYDPSNLVADECAETLGELRFDIPGMGMMPKQLTQAQLYGFTDWGTLHNLAPDVGTPRNVNAASAGGGLRLGWLNMFTADLSADKAVEGPRNDWRFFFVLSARSN